MARLFIGTSGWVYPHWSGVFYPEELGRKEWFAYYSRSFDTVEINNTFYRLPPRETFESWRAMAPGSFSFAVKGSRYMTHVKKLKDPEAATRNFFSNLEGLGNKCAVVLFQLPPRWKANISRLRSFLLEIPQGRRLAFEFRDSSWLNEETYGVLREHSAALCAADSPFHPGPEEVTAPFVYYRMHGGRTRLAPGYSPGELKALAKKIAGHLEAGRDAFAYFNNDYGGFAIEDALKLKELLR